MNKQYLLNVKSKSIASKIIHALAIAVTASHFAACVSPSPQPQPSGVPQCNSGTGTLDFKNNAGESVQLDITDAAGSVPSLLLTTGQSSQEIEPIGDYTITATGSTSHVVLFKNKVFTVACDASASVVISPAPQPLLTVGLIGQGPGSVVSNPSGISCASSVCTSKFSPGASIVLTAQAQAGATFVGWGGACLSSGTASTCAVSLSQSQAVTARFDITSALTGPGARLKNYGGRMLTQSKIAAVFWGGSVDAKTVTDLPKFLASYPMSYPFLSTLNEYLDPQGNAIEQPTFLGAYTLSPPSMTKLQDADIQSALQAAITAGTLPANDGSTVYVVAMPAGYAVSINGATSCQQFCGYHGGLPDTNGKPLLYAVLSDLGHDGCQGGCGTASLPFDNLTALAGQELASAMTDPDVGQTTLVGPPMSWYSPNKPMGEIGDLCLQLGGTATQTVTVSGLIWNVSKLWSNTISSCVISRTLPDPVMLFSSALQQQLSAGGAAGTLSVSAVSLSAGSAVNLVQVGLPAGFTVTFTSLPLSSGGSATVSVQADATVPAGDYLLSLEGSSAGTAHLVNYVHVSVH